LICKADDVKVLPPERVADPERKLTDNGQVEVLDFGLAKLTGTAAPSEPAPLSDE
jgi:hypothetical protein